MTAGLPLIKSVLRPLAKSFDSLELTTVMSAKDVAIKKKSWIRNYSINNFK